MQEHGRADHPVKSHLAFAVLSTVCLCPPLGIAAIVYAVKTMALLIEGESNRAHKSSKIAYALCIVSSLAAFIGLVFAVAIYYGVF